MRLKFKLNAPVRHASTIDEEDLASVFDRFDLQRAGHLNKEVLQEVLSRLKVTVTEEELSGMMQLADSDGDGVIDFDDFKSLMEETRRRSGAFPSSAL
mmetsp:Transcript_23615/g.63749  ORF Transcript_23615/g.63749 Transcript_23615/m.63749 type:complete len:98 (-) Transcript_23615:21-314(-)